MPHGRPQSSLLAACCEAKAASHRSPSWAVGSLYGGPGPSLRVQATRYRNVRAARAHSQASSSCGAPAFCPSPALLQAGGPRVPCLLPPAEQPRGEQGGLQPLPAALLHHLQERSCQRRWADAAARAGAPTALGLIQLAAPRGCTSQLAVLVPVAAAPMETPPV